MVDRLCMIVPNEAKTNEKSPGQTAQAQQETKNRRYTWMNADGED